MAVALEIPDGDPHWWLSPHLRTVPGPDPEGADGVPVAGEPCYVWGRVTNTGTTPVVNATVKFYWANPAVGFDRTTATTIGASNVSLNEGQTEDVLCLTPWVPAYVNNGHECILAEAFHEAVDPLPATSAFNVPTDRHVAQRNLSVLIAVTNVIVLAFEVHNAGRKTRKFTIRARQDEIGTIKQLIPLLGRGFGLPAEQGRAHELGFVRIPCPDAKALKERVPEIEGLELRPQQRAGLTLIGAFEGGAALVHIEQVTDGVVVGGLSALILEEKNVGNY